MAHNSDGRELTARGIYTRDIDPLSLHGSDHPGMVLVTNPLNGANYLHWSRAMKLALSAKSKLSFINGTVQIPDPGSEEHDQYQKVESMVISWILNCISKEIVEAFMYVKSAKQLWEELAERYGETNGPLRYQLQKEIATFSQGSLSVTAYYTKLKCLWDEFSCLVSLPDCTCGTGKAFGALDMEIKLMQFLMGLNEAFEPVKNQILLLEPLPTINRAYSMILKVEKQKSLTTGMNLFENSAMMVKGSFGRGTERGQNFGRGNGGRNLTGQQNNYVEKGRFGQRLSKKERAKLFCTHCKYNGHDVQGCFKLNGYPEWFKELRERRQNQVANMAESDESSKADSETKSQQSESPADIGLLIQREVAKYMSGQHNVEAHTFSHFADVIS